MTQFCKHMYQILQGLAILTFKIGLLESENWYEGCLENCPPGFAKASPVVLCVCSMLCVTYAG